MSRVTISDMERMCRSAGLRPARRLNISGVHVFIAEGFSEKPHLDFQKISGVEEGDFPFGCHVTLYWTQGMPKGFDGGAPLFFEPLRPGDDRARMRATVEAATKFVIEGKTRRLH